MSEVNQTFLERVATRLNAFNKRLEVRLRKNQQLLESMRAEEDFEKSMGYLKKIYGLKGGN